MLSSSRDRQFHRQYDLKYFEINTNCDDVYMRRLTEWIPSSFIEPVEEVVEAILNHVSSGSIVEPGKFPADIQLNVVAFFYNSNYSPWVEFMNNTFKSDNSKQSGSESSYPAHEQHRKYYQRTYSEVRTIFRLVFNLRRSFTHVASDA